MAVINIGIMYESVFIEYRGGFHAHRAFYAKLLRKKNLDINFPFVRGIWNYKQLIWSYITPIVNNCNKVADLLQSQERERKCDYAHVIFVFDERVDAS